MGKKKMEKLHETYSEEEWQHSKMFKRKYNKDKWNWLKIIWRGKALEQIQQIL